MKPCRRSICLPRPKSASVSSTDACKVFVSSDAGESFAAMSLPVQPSRECDLVVSESGIVLTDVLTSANEPGGVLVHISHRELGDPDLRSRS